MFAVELAAAAGVAATAAVVYYTPAPAAPYTPFPPDSFPQSVPSACHSDMAGVGWRGHCKELGVAAAGGAEGEAGGTAEGTGNCSAAEGNSSPQRLCLHRWVSLCPLRWRG